MRPASYFVSTNFGECIVRESSQKSDSIRPEFIDLACLNWPSVRPVCSLGLMYCTMRRLIFVSNTTFTVPKLGPPLSLLGAWHH